MILFFSLLSLFSPIRAALINFAVGAITTAIVGGGGLAVGTIDFGDGVRTIGRCRCCCSCCSVVVQLPHIIMHDTIINNTNIIHNFY